MTAPDCGAVYLQTVDGLGKRTLAGCIRSADGLNLRRIRVQSQFGPVSWSLNGTFAIILAHERRHLWQAREVRKDRAFPS